MFARSIVRNCVSVYRNSRGFYLNPAIPEGLARLARIETEHNEEANQTRVSLHSISSDSFNRTGNVSPWNVFYWITVARWLAYHIPHPTTGRTFLDYDSMAKDMLTFYVATKTFFSKDVVSIISPLAVEIPILDVYLRLGYIGASSLNTVATLVDRATGTKLAHNTNQMALISKNTRKPVRVPEWWRDKYKIYIAENERLLVPLVDIPTDARTIIAHYKMKVPWNDIDAYGHTGYLSYLRFCFDAAADATFGGKYAALNGDILRYPVKEILSTYKNESKANDILDIVSWQNPDHPFLVHFSIQKEDGSTAYQSHIEFYELSD